MIKAAFFDIDGTLVPHGSGKAITPSALEALKLLKTKGVKLFIATGRPYHTAQFVIDQFDWDGVMAMNGQYIVYQGEVIHRLAFDPEGLAEVIKYIDEKEIACSFALETGSFMNRTSEKYNKHPRANAVFKPSSACLEAPTYQVNAYVDECDDDAIIEHFPGAKTARWSDVFSDIIPAEGGKDNGI
ncbi:MAG: HAD-IIB family hydrolase, partial [Erysipelotrichaceae bacterium]|nr:HAD-IIB family hydrolase [Erysipelotrichaceae bacterium]